MNIVKNTLRYGPLDRALHVSESQLLLFADL